jgi:hypothetical protein
MAWAGAVNQEHNAMHTSQCQQPTHNQHHLGESTISPSSMHLGKYDQETNHRRASLDMLWCRRTTSGNGEIDTDRLVYISSSQSGSMDYNDQNWGMRIDNSNTTPSATSYGGNEGGPNHYYDDDGTGAIIGRGGTIAARRNSLHAMVERAIAYVNLRSNANDDDLTPFGTRRDSLY